MNDCGMVYPRKISCTCSYVHHECIREKNQKYVKNLLSELQTKLSLSVYPPPPTLSLSVWLSERALLLWDRWLCARSSLALMTSSAACRSGCSASIPPCLWLLADVCPGTYCTQIPKLIKLECSPSHCSLKWHKHWSGRRVEEGGWGGLSTQKQNQKAGGKTERQKRGQQAFWELVH